MGCPCFVCQDSNPKNKRLRSSILFESKKTSNRYLLDCGPDLRQQLLLHKVEALDGVFLTHAHADHCNGIDDLMGLTFQNPLPFYSCFSNLEILKHRFPYLFSSPSDSKKTTRLPSKAKLNFIALDESKEKISSINITSTREEKIKEADEISFFLLPHGNIFSTAFVFNKEFAYLIDCHEIPECFLSYLSQLSLKCLVLDCTTRPSHPTHLGLELFLKYTQRIQAQETFCIHMGHALEHYWLEETLEKESQGFSKGNCRPAYDGLEYPF